MKKLLARIWLWAFRWKAEGDRPTDPRFVLIAAPHTSNWDLPHLIAFAWYYDVQIAWLAKQQIFRPPFGAFFRASAASP